VNSLSYRDIVIEAAALGRQLLDRGWMLCAAESCTGGLIAAAFTETAGSSAWFDRGFVTYSNEAKQQMLAVTELTLNCHGAVSEPTAREMALGALKLARSNQARTRLAFAVTGIAGPSGATLGKPVGTVCFAWALSDALGVVTLHSETKQLPGDRSAVRIATAHHAIRGAHNFLV
jgi:nicotinamide-nucleotide amidase